MTADCRLEEKPGSRPRGVVHCARKQVPPPHAKDSPRPAAAKAKHVTWGEKKPKVELDGEVRRGEEEEELSAGDPAPTVGRKGAVVRKIGVKGKLQWLFEQDRLYWEVPAAKEKKATTSEESSSPPSAISESDFAAALEEEKEEEEKQELSKNPNVFISPAKVPWSPVEHLSDSVNLGEDDELEEEEEEEQDGDVQFGSSRSSSSSSDDDDTDNDDHDHDSSNFDLEMSHLEMNAPEIEVFVTTPQAPGIIISGMGESTEGVSEFAMSSSSSMDEGGSSSSCFEETRNVKKDPQEWRKQAVAMKAKCELLKMEKEFAQQRWEEGCEQMTQAAEMAHSLHAAVELILEPIRQTVVTSSKSCTPWRVAAEEEKKGLAEEKELLERLERLQIGSDDHLSQKKLNSKAPLHLEHQALHQTLRDRIDILQRKSKLRNMDTSSMVNTGGNCEKQRGTRNQMKSASISSMSLEDGSVLDESEAKDVETKETVRKILAQIQVEAEQWTQVQDVLKHVCTEMATLQQACQGWEQRALNAEFQAAACQLEGDEWRVKAQTAQQRIKEVEVQMQQLQETVQEIKLRHAQEQNRWLDMSRSLGPANILGYTLALQPLSNTTNSCCESCGCSLSTGFEDCRSCGKLCRRVMIVEERQGTSGGGSRHAGCERHSFGGSVHTLPSQCRQRNPSAAHGNLPRFPSPCMRHATTGSVARAPSPCTSASQEHSRFQSTRVRQKYHNPRHQQNFTHTAAENVRAVAIAEPSSDHKPAMKSEVERLSSQGESQQQTPTRQQQQLNLPAQYGHVTKSQNRENTKGSGKSFARMQRKGGGGAVQGQRSPMRKVGQSPAGSSFRGSAHSASSFNAVQRAPLKEVSANIIPGKH